MNDLVVAFILVLWVIVGGCLAGWLLTRKKKGYDPYQHTFTAPVTGTYLIYYRYYNLEKGQTITVKFIENGTKDEAWKKALKKLKPKHFLVR